MVFERLARPRAESLGALLVACALRFAFTGAGSVQGLLEMTNSGGSRTLSVALGCNGEDATRNHVRRYPLLLRHTRRISTAERSCSG
jgi:hypothetical protein